MDLIRHRGSREGVYVLSGRITPNGAGCTITGGTQDSLDQTLPNLLIVAAVVAWVAYQYFRNGVGDWGLLLFVPLFLLTMKPREDSGVHARSMIRPMINLLRSAARAASPPLRARWAAAELTPSLEMTTGATGLRPILGPDTIHEAICDILPSTPVTLRRDDDATIRCEMIGPGFIVTFAPLHGAPLRVIRSGFPLEGQPLHVVGMDEAFAAMMAYAVGGGPSEAVAWEEAPPLL